MITFASQTSQSGRWCVYILIYIQRTAIRKGSRDQRAEKKWGDIGRKKLRCLEERFERTRGKLEPGASREKQREAEGSSGERGRGKLHFARR